MELHEQIWQIFSSVFVEFLKVFTIRAVFENIFKNWIIVARLEKFLLERFVGNFLGVIYLVDCRDDFFILLKRIAINIIGYNLSCWLSIVDALNCLWSVATSWHCLWSIATAARNCLRSIVTATRNCLRSVATSWNRLLRNFWYGSWNINLRGKCGSQYISGIWRKSTPADSNISVRNASRIIAGNVDIEPIRRAYITENHKNHPLKKICAEFFPKVEFSHPNSSFREKAKQLFKYACILSKIFSKIQYLPKNFFK